MVDVLFFRPSYELATEYLHAWFGRGIDEAEKLGYRVVDIAGDAATRDTLLDALGTYTFSALFLGGHGNSTTFTGQDSKVVFKACQNDEVLAGNIAFYLSCFVGQELGPSNISKGVVSFVGFMSDFRFMVDTSYPILDDPLAEPFEEVVVEIIRRVLWPRTIEDVWNGGVAKCDEWITKISPRPETVWGDVISAIKHDRDCFIALGDRQVYAARPARLAPVGLTLGPIGLGSILATIGLA